MDDLRTAPSAEVDFIHIRFASVESKRAALGQLAGRDRFKSWASGEMLVPEDALPFLAVEGVPFIV